MPPSGLFFFFLGLFQCPEFVWFHPVYCGCESDSPPIASHIKWAVGLVHWNMCISAHNEINHRQGCDNNWCTFFSVSFILIGIRGIQQSVDIWCAASKHWVPPLFFDEFTCSAQPKFSSIFWWQKRSLLSVLYVCCGWALQKEVQGEGLHLPVKKSVKSKWWIPNRRCCIPVRFFFPLRGGWCVGGGQSFYKGCTGYFCTKVFSNPREFSVQSVSNPCLPKAHCTHFQESYTAFVGWQGTRRQLDNRRPRPCTGYPERRDPVRPAGGSDQPRHLPRQPWQQKPGSFDHYLAQSSFEVFWGTTDFRVCWGQCCVGYHFAFFFFPIQISNSACSSGMINRGAEIC